MINRYDEWKLSAGPEDTREVIGHCDNCLDDVLEGDEVYKRGDVLICDIGCLVEYEDSDDFTKIQIEKGSL